MTLSREARLAVGIALLTVPTIMYSGAAASDEHVGAYESRAVSARFPRALEIHSGRLLPCLSLTLSVVDGHAAPLLVAHRSTP
jgi:hypothetical protein